MAASAPTSRRSLLEREAARLREPARRRVGRGAPDGHPQGRARQLAAPFAAVRRALPLEPVARNRVPALGAGHRGGAQLVVVGVVEEAEPPAQRRQGERGEPVPGRAPQQGRLGLAAEAAGPLGAKARAHAHEKAGVPGMNRPGDREPPLRGGEGALHVELRAGGTRLPGHRAGERVGLAVRQPG